MISPIIKYLHIDTYVIKLNGTFLIVNFTDALVKSRLSVTHINLHSLLLGFF